MLLLKKDVPEKCPGVLQDTKPAFLNWYFFPLSEANQKKIRLRGRGMENMQVFISDMPTIPQFSNPNVVQFALFTFPFHSICHRFQSQNFYMVNKDSLGQPASQQHLSVLLQLTPLSLPVQTFPDSNLKISMSRNYMSQQ